MLSKERKKHTGSNINININLKVENKHPSGRKINKEKEVQINSQTIRPTGQLYKQKKNSCQELPHHKQSVQQFLQDKSIRYEINDQNYNAFNRIEKAEPLPKPQKLNSRKRAKSKSLENLKVKYYARTPEPLSKSNSKINSKSKSKSKLTSKSKSKINSKSRSKSKKKYADTDKSSPRQFLHSSKKQKSKSKSPLISKKRSLQTFRLNSRQIEREKSKEKKYQKSTVTCRKNQQSQPSFQKCNKGTVNIPIPKKENTGRIQNRKSKDKIKTQSPSKHIKTSAPLITTKPKPKKSKKTKQSKIFPQIFLENMATKIQSFWRGYIVRKHFKEELNQITAKITSIRNSMALKRQDFWQTQSNHSIIQLESSSGMGSRTHKNMSERSNSESLNPQFMIQLQRLRKKLQEQQDRFKLLAEQNNQLKANLSKISRQPQSTEKKLPERPLIFSNNVISMRIQSEESEADPQDLKGIERKEESRKRIREKMLALPAAIKTEESKDQYDISDLKKKVESFECSPKNQDCSLFKFNKKLIKKLFTHQEEKINQKYFKKNTEFRNLLETQLISPKTYNQRWSELQLKLKKQRQDTMRKFKEAQQAMLLVAQLQQEEQGSYQIDQQNLNRNVENTARQNIGCTPDKKNSQSSLQSSPGGKKTVNLFISVDQIEINHEKYTPIFTHNAHRDITLEKEEDLSELYHQVMEEQEQRQYNQKRNTIQVAVEPQQHLIQENEVQSKSKEESTEVVNIDIAHYPDFQLAGEPQSQKIRGFQTSLRYIRQFYIKFCEFFRQIPVFRQQILENIISQITFDSQIYLRSFRMLSQQQSCGQLIFPYFKYLATYNTTIPVHILNSFYSELTNQDSQLFSKDTYQLKMTSKEEYQEFGYSSYELKQYYDLALIDAFNQAINFQRPGGADASNLDQLTHQYRTICKQKVSKKLMAQLPRERQDNLSSILGNTIGRIINIWACSLCGFINDNMDGDEKINQQQLQEIRTKRLTLLLENSLIQEESSVVNLHPFGLYVKLEVANLVAEELAVQFALEMSNKYRRR